MLARWSQVFSLAILVLNATRVAALETRSIESEIIDDALRTFEHAVGDVVSDILDDSDGVLAQFTLDYSTYAKTTQVLP